MLLTKLVVHHVDNFGFKVLHFYASIHFILPECSSSHCYFFAKEQVEIVISNRYRYKKCVISLWSPGTTYSALSRTFGFCFCFIWIFLYIYFFVSMHTIVVRLSSVAVPHTNCLSCFISKTHASDNIRQICCCFKMQLSNTFICLLHKRIVLVKMQAA